MYPALHAIEAGKLGGEESASTLPPLPQPFPAPPIPCTAAGATEAASPAPPPPPTSPTRSTASSPTASGAPVRCCATTRTRSSSRFDSVGYRALGLDIVAEQDLLATS